MITQEAITIPIIPHQKLNPRSVDEFLDVFERFLDFDQENGMELDFTIDSKLGSDKISPSLFLTKPEDAFEIKTIKHANKEIATFFDFYNHNLETIKGKSRALKEIIRDNGGKVRIYVAQNHGPDKGYHILAEKSFEAFLPPRQSLGAQYQRFNFDANRFDLNLADPDIDKKIEYIIALSLTYEKEHQMDNMFFMTRNEIKEDGKNIPIWLYDSFICAFDRHRFYEPDEIFSNDQVSVRSCYPLAFTKIEDGAILRQEHVKEWKKFDHFITAYYTRILGATPFLQW